MTAQVTQRYNELSTASEPSIAMPDRRVCDGQALKQLFTAGAAWLEKHADRINQLNVFPVPDGDTGTNMLLTMQAAVAEVAGSSSQHAGQIAQQLSHGALMGARGNSGVILSQILCGFARAIENDPSFGTQGFARALRESCNTAYSTVTDAVEGTILTVIRAIADEAEVTAQKTDDLHAMLTHVVETADVAVQRTPTQLKTLRDAGVVDAGGLGLQVIFEGALRYLQGEALDITLPKEPPRSIEFHPTDGTETAYGYCTEFVIRGQNLDYDQIKQDLLQMGDSALIVGDDSLIRVHIHTFRPGQVLDYATDYGSLHKIKIDNMQEQHAHFRELGLTKGAGQPTAEPPYETPRAGVQSSGISVIAVVPGPGLEEVFKSMGASVTIRGGQTMNPSTQDILEAIHSVASNQIIVLPNNKNVLLAAQQAVALSDRQVGIVPTYTVPQGLSALLSLNGQTGLEENVRVMTQAMLNIRCAEITRAVRSARIGNVEVQEGEVIGLLNGQLVACNHNIDDMVLEMLRHMEADSYDIITAFYGEDVRREQAERVGQRIRDAYPEQEVEVLFGGQPYYHYILAAE